MAPLIYLISKYSYFHPKDGCRQKTLTVWNYLSHFSQTINMGKYRHSFSLPSSDSHCGCTPPIYFSSGSWSAKVQEAESTHRIQLYPAPSMNINKFCEKLLFREEVMRTKSRKAKTMLEAWQKCSKKPLSEIISIYKYICGIITGHCFKDIFSSSSLAQIPWNQKMFPWISSEIYWNLPSMGWSWWTG